MMARVVQMLLSDAGFLPLRAIPPARRSAGRSRLPGDAPSAGRRLARPASPAFRDGPRCRPVALLGCGGV